MLKAVLCRGHKPRARRLAGAPGAVLLAACGTALAGLASCGRTPPARLAAWTVTKAPHGLIAIRVSQLSDPAGLQRELRADGVPAAVAFQRGAVSLTPPLPRECHDTGLSPRESAAIQGRILGPQPSPLGGPRSMVALTIRPAQIPENIGVNLTVQSGGSSWGWSLGLVRATPECTG